MSQEIQAEMMLLGVAVLLGGMGAFCYDGLRAWRRLCLHGTWWMGIEDLLFWTISGLVVFTVMLEENQGILRWYVLAGCVLGAVSYQRWIRPLVWKVLRRLWRAMTILRRNVENLLKK